MSNLSLSQIQQIRTFEELLETPFSGAINAMCFNRDLQGDFSEIVAKFEMDENILEIDIDDLEELILSEKGQLAREILLNDLNLLKEFGASPVLNLIKSYDADKDNPIFPTDVYSFHVDRSPIPTATFLCTYFGEASEIVPNSQAVQKILIPEIRAQLLELHSNSKGNSDFDSFLSENFFDLHYKACENAEIVNLGLGNLWKIAVDHPNNTVLPCLHRAPKEINGQTRLLLIC
jgi:hypothetical protein